MQLWCTVGRKWKVLLECLVCFVPLDSWEKAHLNAGWQNYGGWWWHFCKEKMTFAWPCQLDFLFVSHKIKLMLCMNRVIHKKKLEKKYCHATKWDYKHNKSPHVLACCYFYRLSKLMKFFFFKIDYFFIKTGTQRNKFLRLQWHLAVKNCNIPCGMFDKK